MSERRTKWDDRVYFDPKRNRMVWIKADCIWAGVQEWWHYDGEKCWWAKGKFQVPKHYVEIDRLPERTL